MLTIKELQKMLLAAAMELKAKSKYFVNWIVWQVMVIMA